MNYTEWLTMVQKAITDDPLWKMEVYRLGLFLGDLAWFDYEVESDQDIAESEGSTLSNLLENVPMP